MIQNQVLSFFVELFNRLRTKSPKVFKVLQLFAASLTLLGYIPSILQRWFNFEVPGNVITLFEDVSKYATGFFVAVLLPVKSPAVAQTEQGEPVRVTDENKFPYTAKAETAAMEKEVPPPPVVDVPEPPKQD